VIPFRMEKAEGVFGTSLLVGKEAMRLLPGIRITEGAPYPETVRGVYSHISSFEMSLRREFVHHGEKVSLVNAVCTPPRGFSTVSFPLLQVNLGYASGTATTDLVESRCAVR
jgi:hypothetical protein